MRQQAATEISSRASQLTSVVVIERDYRLSFLQVPRSINTKAAQRLMKPLARSDAIQSEKVGAAEFGGGRILQQPRLRRAFFVDMLISTPRHIA